ncbi:uncharacterized protein LOC130644267 [Hydractinia symbiolongicarpus]|uniref:uncharacterized protein LOC130644267 n=1 Tax=Hydractinia symbiolongicarpus TaxID=13093 RepID=UPI0025517B46|nr:uncharacterized protein LOC130644267 [Hydractinia symbiolongicarpus]
MMMKFVFAVACLYLVQNTCTAAPLVKTPPCESYFPSHVCKEYNQYGRKYKKPVEVGPDLKPGMTDAMVVPTLSPAQKFLQFKRMLKHKLYFWVQFLVAIRLIRDIRDTGGDLKGRCDQRVEEAPYYVDRLLNRGMLGLLRLGLEVNDDLHLIKPPWERS